MTRRRFAMLLGCGLLALPAAGWGWTQSDLLAKLQSEVDKVMSVGTLTPFRMEYGEGDNYNYLYGGISHRYAFYEPWMMMYTLGRAYPYVSSASQTQIRSYVHNEVLRQAPWSASPLGAGAVSRQGDPAGVETQDLPALYVRTGMALYACWLYGSNTGDWTDIQPNWATLKSTYTTLKSGRHTYELISGAIAMSRMAQQFGDAAAKSGYDADIVAFETEGLAFATYRDNANLDYSGRAAAYRGVYGMAFVLFNLTPEVAAYINANSSLKNALVSYIETLPATQNDTESLVDVSSAYYIWPLWWMAQTPIGDGGYFGECLCGGAQTRNMLFGYTAWIKNVSGSALAYYVDAPDALVGDAYYMQNLVTAIESFGPVFTPTHTPVVSPTPSATATPTRTATPNQSPTPTPTVSATRTPTRTATPSATASGTPTATVTRTATRTATASATGTATGTATRTATATRTHTPVYSPTASPTVTPTPSETPVLSPTPSPSVTATLTVTAGAAPGEPGTRLPTRVLSPGLADGINDSVAFDPEATELWIFDLRGREVYSARGSSLVWNGRSADGRRCPSGEYLAKLKIRDGGTVYQPLVLVK